MHLIVIEYRHTYPLVLTALNADDAQRAVDEHFLLNLPDRTSAFRATIFRHIPGVATAGLVEKVCVFSRSGAEAAAAL